jgi:hypothetical protein
MNLEEMVKRLGITSTETQSYMEKAEQSDLRYCEDHDREYYDFEFQGQCPVCHEETLWRKYEHHGDEGARQVLKKSGRLNEEEED